MGKVIWRRYTNLDVLVHRFLDTELELTRLIVKLLGEYLGNKTYEKQKEAVSEKRKKDKIIQHEMRILGAHFSIVNRALGMYRIYNDKRLLEFRDCILAMDSETLRTSFHVDEFSQLSYIFPDPNQCRLINRHEYESFHTLTNK